MDASNPDTATAPIADTEKNSTKPKSWRDVLPIHPAAELFPLMSEAELRELAADIERNRLTERIDLYDDPELGLCVLDGRNRLDALELLDWEGGSWGYARPSSWDKALPWGLFEGETRRARPADFDPWAFAVSKNVHRRHFTADQRRELIAKVLKARPEASNRQIAKQIKGDDKTVAKIRTELEARSEIPNVGTRVDTKGRSQPARRTAHKSKPKSPALPAEQRTTNLVPLDAEALRTAIAEVETRLLGDNIEQIKEGLRALRNEIDRALNADYVVWRSAAAVLQ